MYMNKAIDVSVIIVNYNTKNLLNACLGTVFRTSGMVTSEVIVVDNASTDGSTAFIKAKYSSVYLIQNSKNLGFAAANNKGIQLSHGRYILLLNSDTEMREGVLDYMVDFMDKHSTVGASTCKVLLPNGRIDPACHRGFPTPWASFTYFVGMERLFPRSKLFGQYHLGYKDMNRTHDIDSPMGAFFLVRREVVDQVGSLDESFFMYGEDLDWAYRIRKAGWRILFCPEKSIFHRKKQSGRAKENMVIRRETDKHFYEAMAIFYRKHYKTRYGSLTSAIILFLIAARVRFSYL